MRRRTDGDGWAGQRHGRADVYFAVAELLVLQAVAYVMQSCM